MRLKGSLEWLKFGLEFAEAVTVEIDDFRGKHGFVDCKGSNSVFAALSWSIPSIVRMKEDSTCVRGSISETELYKYLAKSGYVAYRHRSRVKGTKDRWTKGVCRWERRRWVDLKYADHLEHLRAKLIELRKFCTPSIFLSESRLFEFLSAKSNAEEQEFAGAGLEPASEVEIFDAKHLVPRGHFATHRR